MNVVLNNSVAVSGLAAQWMQDLSLNSTVGDIAKFPLEQNESQYHISVRDNARSSNVSLVQMESLLERVNRTVSRQGVVLKYFQEVPVERKFSGQVDAIYAWESSDGELTMCHYSDMGGHLSCGSADLPLLNLVKVTSLAASPVARAFAVTSMDEMKDRWMNSVIFTQLVVTDDDSTNSFISQTIPTKLAVDSVAFVLNNQSCFLFVEEAIKSPIYCRPLLTDRPYILFQNLSTVNARMVRNYAATR